MDTFNQWNDGFEIPNRNSFSNVFYFRKLSFALVKEKHNGDYWAVNEKGERTSNVYHPSKIGFEDTYGNFEVGVVRIESNGKYGLLGKGGIEITPCEYDWPIYFEKGESFAAILKDNTKGLIGSDGKVISKFYNLSEYEISNKKNWTHKFLFHFDENGLASIEENGKFGILKNTGEEVAKCFYDSYLIQKYNEFQNVSINGKYGIMSNTGRILLSCEYDTNIYFNKLEVANVRKDGKYGLIDRNFSEIAPCIYDKPFNDWRYSNGLAYNEINGENVFFDENWQRTSEFAYDDYFDGEWVNGFSEVCRNNKFGFIDEKGIEVVPCIYGVIWDFRYYLGAHLLAEVGRDGKKGYVGIDGTEVIPCVYDHELGIYFNSGSKNYAIVQKDGRKGVIDINHNQIVPFNYDEIYFCYEDKEYFSCHIKDEGAYLRHYQNGSLINKKPISSSYTENEFGFITNSVENKINKFGFIPFNGGQEIPCEYEYLKIEKNFIVVNLSQKRGVFDLKGNLLLPCIYNNVYIEDGIIIVRVKNLIGAFKNNGEEFLPIEYYSIAVNEKVIFLVNNLKIRCINRDKNDIFNMEFANSDIQYLGHDLIGIRENGKWGIANSNGTIMVKSKYEDLKQNLSAPLFPIKNFGYWGFLDKYGREEYIPQYNDFFFLKNKLIAVKKGETWHLLNETGKAIDDSKYEEIKSLNDQYSCVKSSGLWSLVNSAGVLELDFIYEDITLIENQLILKKSGFWNLYDWSFNVISEIQFTDFVRVGYSCTLIKNEDKWGLMDRKLKQVLSFIFDEFKIISYWGTIAFQRNSKWGIINNSLETVLPFEYDNIFAKENEYGDFSTVSSSNVFSKVNLFIVYKSNKYGLVSDKGNLLIECQFDNSKFHFGNGFAIVQQVKEVEEKVLNLIPKRKSKTFFGYVNEAGKYVIPCIYDYVENFQNGTAKVTLSGKKGKIDTKGIFIKE